MTGNPYRAGGVYDGVAYVERESDARLYLEIERNSSHLLVTAPRQGGRTSAMHRVRRRMVDKGARCAFVDFSAFPKNCFSELDRFLAHLAVDLCTSLGIPVVGHDDMMMLMGEILSLCSGRVVIFLDDVDMVRGQAYDEYFFSTIRASFNRRPVDEKFRRLQFVMSGFSDPEQLMGTRLFSPYNVGIDITLQDLDLDGVCSMTEHLEGGETRFENDPASFIYDYTRGSVYLTQVVLEHLWQSCRSCCLVTADGCRSHILAIVEKIIVRAPRDAHFLAIYKAAHAMRLSPELVANILEGKSVHGVEASVLVSAGIVGDDFRIRNPIYGRVFSSDGSLPLLGDAIPGFRDSSFRSATAARSQYASEGAVGSRGSGLLGMNLAPNEESAVAISVHCEGDIYMGDKNVSTVGTGSIVGAVGVGSHANSKGAVNSGNSASSGTKEQHFVLLQDIQMALVRDQQALDEIDGRLFDALGQFLRLARAVQLEDLSLAEVQAALMRALDATWEAKGLASQALPAGLKVVEALAKCAVTAEVAKRLGA